MASSSLRPALVLADKDGNIFDHPDLAMVCRQGEGFALPRPSELMPLPDESELFLLPGRNAVGLNTETGELEVVEDALAVAAFVSPAHTITAHPAYETRKDAPVLPLFAYGALGFANGRFYVCAKKVDDDPRQVFKDIPRKTIEKKAHALMRAYPDNRLIQHLMAKCVLTYACPAARNLCLGRYEAPLPTSRVCNAHCVGCISRQDKDSKICTTPQDRLTFTPTPKEIVEVMLHHAANEKERPIFSFGQGCEGEPLTEADRIAEAIAMFRAAGGKGTVNINSNASMPEAIIRLAEAGLSSLRVSCNSAREDTYQRYYRPGNYTLADVIRSIREARVRGIFVSLNLLYFPGVTDTERETEALVDLVRETDINCIQLRNLNIDPELYYDLMTGISFGPHIGFTNFRKRIKRACPTIQFGYFNPFVADDNSAHPTLAPHGQNA